VAADVAEGTEFAVFVADRFVTHNDDGFSGDLNGEEGLGVGDGAVVATRVIERSGQLLGAAKKSWLSQSRGCGVGVELGFEGMGTLDLFVKIECDGVLGMDRS